MLQKVIKGKDEWLFLDNDSNKVLQQITGELTFSQRRLMQWQYILETRFLWLREKGIPYFFLIAPNKECVYPEYLPEDIKISESRCINQLDRFLLENSFFKILYPLEELQSAKQHMPVYRMMDTHWNCFGAFVAYQRLMKEITKRFEIPVVSQSSLNFYHSSQAGDLGTKLGIAQENTIDVEFLDGSKSSCVFDNQINNTGKLLIFENQNNNLPKAVIFRDSFAMEMLPFLAESFSKLVVSWQPNLDYTLIENEKPDLVIGQQVERYLISIPNDSHDLTNAERVREKTQINTKVENKSISEESNSTNYYGVDISNLVNIALHKSASQSSLSRWSKSTESKDAVNGVKTGKFGFHTELENDPWWLVNLENIYDLEKIIIFNRDDEYSTRANHLSVLVSIDEENWNSIYTAINEFGGFITNKPLIINCNSNVSAKYVKIQINGRQALHLDEVEVYVLEKSLKF
jgi:alginate O-acetyltransferase complex protein AlgJ